MRVLNRFSVWFLFIFVTNSLYAQEFSEKSKLIGTELLSLVFGGYLGHYSREGAEKGWHFLTGEQENITTLADSLGFGYVFDKPTGVFLHTSSIMFLTPDGRISKYMNDVKFESQDLRFALVEASEGKIGSALDKILLFNCFQYDPDRNSYTPSAWKLMRTAAVLMIITLALGLAVLSYTTPDKLRHAHAGMDGNTA